MTALVVLAAGGGATLQDFGRPGYGRSGVPEAGAMDRLSLQLANRLVGNDEGEACIEFAMLGGHYEMAEGKGRIAVAGGDFDIAIDGTPLPAFQSALVPAGAILAIGRARAGVYGYLAIEGGFDRPRVLGSRSVHVRSGMGGGPLKSGERLSLRQDAPSIDQDLGLDRALWPRQKGPIRVVWGPQDDYFNEAAKTAFLSGDYAVSLQSDRMGYRLEGPEIAHAGDFNIVSDGIVLGSIQVPGTRQPIVLLADRQSTGGYPKIATVISSDIRRLVQRRPQEPIRFVAVSVDEADAILREERSTYADLCTAVRPVVPMNLFDAERLLGLNLVDGFVSGDP